jgi:hypothetical protein
MKKRGGALFLVLVLCLTATSSCGKKGDPKPPVISTPQEANDQEDAIENAKKKNSPSGR